MRCDRDAISGSRQDPPRKIAVRSDLDGFIDHADPLHNMLVHQAESHALCWLTLVAPLLGASIARLYGVWPPWRRCLLATWLVLLTRPLLDTLSIYGIQLTLSFSPPSSLDLG